MSASIARTLLAVALLFGAFAASGPSEAYVGRCAQCGTATDVDAFQYAPGEPAAAKTGAILAPEAPRKAGTERGTRIEIRMDKGGTRVIEVHGDPRVYKGDRVRLYRDRIELL